MGRFGDGIAIGSDLVAAAEQAVQRALAPLGGRAPDLAVVFAAGGKEAIDAGERAVELTGARVAIGATFAGVLGGGRGVDDSSAVSVFVACLPGADLRPFHLEVLPAGLGAAIVGFPERTGCDDEVALLLADAWSFPVEGFVVQAAASLPGLPFVGGMAEGPSPGTTRMWVDGRTVERGAVGVLMGGTGARPMLASGCRPVGPAMTITAAAGTHVLGLAGLPAVEKLSDLLADLTPQDQALASQGLLVGIAADEYADDHDYLVRSMLGTEGTALVIGERVTTGQTLKLHVRDADAADEDLQEVLAQYTGPPGCGALVFSGLGRGGGLFGPSYGGAGHDGDVARTALAADAVAGCFASGEIGPVAGRSYLHGFTSSVLVLP